LLVAPVCEPGARKLSVNLPAGASWFDFWSGARLAGGAVYDIDAPLGRPVVFAREGAAIAMNIAEQHFDHRADERAFLVISPARGAVRGACFEDDGESVLGNKHGLWNVAIECGDSLKVACSKTGPVPPAAPTLALLFRPNERRPLAGGTVLSDAAEAEWRKVVVAVP
ncbi:MAG TPA: hypothetical protein VKB71_07725, partial [Rhizomicrobium sp.]|nr:hypothetical protein [Rhizomicrobium sp.]